MLQHKAQRSFSDLAGSRTSFVRVLLLLQVLGEDLVLVWSSSHGQARRHPAEDRIAWTTRLQVCNTEIFRGKQTGSSTGTPHPAVLSALWSWHHAWVSGEQDPAHTTDMALSARGVTYHQVKIILSISSHVAMQSASFAFCHPWLSSRTLTF